MPASPWELSPQEGTSSISREEGPVRQRIVWLAVVTRLICRLRWGSSRGRNGAAESDNASVRGGAGSRQNYAAATESVAPRETKLTCGNPRRNFARDATAIPFCLPTSTREETMALYMYRAGYTAESWAAYQWGSFTAKDYFCPTCGILPFRRPSRPTKGELARGVRPFNGWAVNVRCLEGVDVDALPRRVIHGSQL